MPEETTIPKKRTKKQELWCKLYVSNGHNGTKAAIDAGYSENSAKQIATENLSKPYLIEYINELEKPIVDRLGLDEDWVLSKLKRYSEANIVDFFDFKTIKISKDEGKKKKETSYIDVSLKDLKKLPRELTECIQELSQTAHGYKLKLVDKKSSVEDVGKHLGMFKELIGGEVNHNVSGKVYIIPAFGGNVDDTSNTKQPG
jgi:phage terminase small subunit